MAIGTITMILANVGLSIFNNWAGSRQNKQIAEKREEFERAVREGQRERMLQLMREGQQLTLELEEQKHKERLSELNDQFDNLIKELAYSAAIEHWPLKTLPIVMKNQALGNLLANQEEKVALHCILTSSNCREFNDYVLPKVESTLEAYCNVHWSTLTGSPVLFYSGAWKSNDVPTGTQVDSMRAALSNLPTLLITPFFRPHDHKLVFQVHVWGVGYNNSDQFTIPVIEPTEFQRNYTDELKWLAEDGLIEEAVEDLVPYLQCLIGYIADTYFWSAFGSVPQLPRMLTDGTINTDGMKYLVDDTCGYYSNLLTTSEKKSLEQPFAEDNLLNLYDGVSVLWDEDTKLRKIEEVFVTFCSRKERKYDIEYTNVLCYSRNDVTIVNRFYDYFKKHGSRHIVKVEEIQSILNLICFDFDILKCIDITYLDGLSQKDVAVAAYRLGEIYEYSIGVKYNYKKSQEYYEKSYKLGFVLSIFKLYLYKERTDLIDYHKALTILVNEGIPQAVLLQAEMYLNGTFVKEDVNACINMLDEQDEIDHPYYNYLGALALSKCDAEKYKKDIVRLLGQSAIKGYVNAQLRLAVLYRGRSYIDESPELHYHFAKLAADQGNVDGFALVGFCLLTGYGVPKSIDSAYDYIKRAAELGDIKSIKLLKHI